MSTIRSYELRNLIAFPFQWMTSSTDLTGWLNVLSSVQSRTEAWPFSRINNGKSNIIYCSPPSSSFQQKGLSVIVLFVKRIHFYIIFSFRLSRGFIHYVCGWVGRVLFYCTMVAASKENQIL